MPTLGFGTPPNIQSPVDSDNINYYAKTGTLSVLQVLDFPSTSAQNSSDITVPVTGAVLNDIVLLGVPNGSTLSNSCFTAWVSASNVVTIRFNNYSSGPLDPASGTFKVRVLK